MESFEHGEAVLHVQKDGLEADAFYLLAIQKGTLLKSRLLEYRQRKAEEERLRIATEAARLEEERLMHQAVEAEERFHEQERVRALHDAQTAASKNGAQARELQSTAHTVRRGETLPQIAARFEIYNDASLWPIIYRANRDQIRDPKQLWPGQVLNIPRHFSRDEAKDAKRFSGKK